MRGLINEIPERVINTLSGWRHGAVACMVVFPAIRACVLKRKVGLL